MLIPISVLNSHFNLNISGILHIGAHECEEMLDYNNIGVTNDKIFWIEAIPNKVDTIKTLYPMTNIINAVIDTEDDKEVDFYITNNGQSSSILEFGSHTIHHPEVVVNETHKYKTSRMDTVIDKYKIPVNELNFINLDIQGVELRALKSMEKYLDNFKYIYTEVNSEYVYKECNLINEIDEYLKTFGFTRVVTKMAGNAGWGDAFYIKQ
jgi:FkbM family methyltransferase